MQYLVNMVLIEMAYIWHELGIMMLATNTASEDLNANIKTINVSLNSTIPREIGVSLQRTPEPYEYLLLEGFPINLDIPFSDLLDYTQASFEDFGVRNGGYRWEYNCGDKKLGYFAEVSGTWRYKGVGHLQFKSHPDPHNENPIRDISIGIKQQDE